jgi:hypothetical protein
VRDTNPKVQVNYANRTIVLDYRFQDASIPNSIDIEGNPAMGICPNDSEWKTLEKLAQYSLIRAALKKEQRGTRLLKIIGVEEDFEGLDVQDPDKISLRLKGTAIYS